MIPLTVDAAISLVRNHLSEIKRQIRNPLLFGKYIDKETVNWLEKLANICIEGNAANITSDNMRMVQGAHMLENYFNEISDLLAEIEKNNQYARRRMPRGFNRDGQAFY